MAVSGDRRHRQHHHQFQPARSSQVFKSDQPVQHHSWPDSVTRRMDRRGWRGDAADFIHGGDLRSVTFDQLCILTALAICLIAIIESAVFGETVSAQKLAGLGLAITGVALVATS